MNEEHGIYSGVVDIARNGVDEVIRLRALNAELVEALQRYHRIVSANAIDLDCDAAIDKAHAALAKVEANK